VRFTASRDSKRTPPMKKLELVLPILIVGSLWGIAEILPLPTAGFIVAAILLLTLARVFVNRVGTSTLMGLVACAIKTTSISFVPCTWGGILAVAVSYDLLATLIWRTEKISLLWSAILGFSAATLAAPMFLAWVYWIVPEPYWVAQGLPRAIDYLVSTGLWSALFSIAGAPLGMMAGAALWRLLPAGQRALERN